MYMYEVDLHVFPSNSLFLFFLSLACFFSTRFIVFIGCVFGDAATLENGWCDFYRRTGNIGHKTCLLYFPQPKTGPSSYSSCQRAWCLWEMCVMYKEQVSHTFLLRRCFLRNKYTFTCREKIRKQEGCDMVSQPTLNIFL